MERMTRAALASTYRERQHLHDRIDLEGLPIEDRVLSEVRHQIGMQSQAPLPPYTALWTRITGFEPLAASALVRSGALVRVVCMRSTIHLVRAEDAWSLRSLTAPVLEREFTSAIARRVPGVDVAAVVDRAAGVLDGADLPARDLGRDLASRFDGSAPADLVNLVRCHLPLVQRPPRGEWGATGGVVYARLDQHVPVHEVEPLEEVRSLVLRYLGAYGPATPADFAQWSGLRGAREVFASLGDAVVPVEVEGRTLVDRADAVRDGGERKAPTARLLAEFDAAVLSHADRARILPDPSVIASPNGLIPATFLVDGAVAGTWSLSIADGEAHASLHPAGTLSQRVQSALRRELRSLARTLHGARLTDTTLSPG
ncbi:winged helix DNA-binding domain-containing protein [Labedella endophytica]|uniref:Winged helix DNA-binding domain-containing protein n=1 Tax=Labedella endophytica TaxID=1523160 RepID=A0A3S0VIH5_9MICO|nr:winged helix DNA-binding domain-containing protein [Labedella endophytica]RUR03319.1 winged helix DNA-binding domain-containing protein [Labedella endophytica]